MIAWKIKYKKLMCWRNRDEITVRYGNQFKHFDARDFWANGDGTYADGDDLYQKVKQDIETDYKGWLWGYFHVLKVEDD
jgi:hypothetical protein